jgi:hypothetical protein
LLERDRDRFLDRRHRRLLMGQPPQGRGHEHVQQDRQRECDGRHAIGSFGEGADGVGHEAVL